MMTYHIAALLAWAPAAPALAAPAPLLLGPYIFPTHTISRESKNGFHQESMQSDVYYAYGEGTVLSIRITE
jgi:hypothetical protein